MVGKQKRVERLSELQTRGRGVQLPGGFFLFSRGGESFCLFVGGGEGRPVFAAADPSELRVGEGWRLSRLPVLCRAKCLS